MDISLKKSVIQKTLIHKCTLPLSHISLKGNYSVWAYKPARWSKIGFHHNYFVHVTCIGAYLEGCNRHVHHNWTSFKKKAYPYYKLPPPPFLGCGTHLLKLSKQRTCDYSYHLDNFVLMRISIVTYTFILRSNACLFTLEGYNILYHCALHMTNEHNVHYNIFFAFAHFITAPLDYYGDDGHRKEKGYSTLIQLQVWWRKVVYIMTTTF